MPAIQSGTPACPDSAARQRRLALQLADMIPGAATIRVSLRDPQVVWPHPHARVWDAEGQPIELSRTRATVAARWIVRVWPDADWTRPHTLDLASAVLTRSNSVSARRGR
ncbi:transcriptional regulator [Streptomyces sp. NPDC056672]|uniref:transcriptional regulator n=1 Tax=Streptomyces sp. NPDC056672 TaxID=3345906 RepID=UPI0036B5BBAD